MAKRKQTPDVLAEVLGGDAPAAEEANSAPRAARVQKQAESSCWEYCLISFQEYRGWRPRFINGHELKDWMNAPLIHEYLQRMGDDGWELAAAGSGERMYGSADNHQLYFRRPKE